MPRKVTLIGESEISGDMHKRHTSL